MISQAVISEAGTQACEARGGSQTPKGRPYQGTQQNCPATMHRVANAHSRARLQPSPRVRSSQAQAQHGRRLNQSPSPLGRSRGNRAAAGTRDAKRNGRAIMALWAHAKGAENRTTQRRRRKGGNRTTTTREGRNTRPQRAPAPKGGNQATKGARATPKGSRRGPATSASPPSETTGGTEGPTPEPFAGLHN